MTGHLLADLAVAVGADHVVTDPVSRDSAETDWTGRFRGSTPAVISPSSTHEVAAVIEVCRRHGVGIVPQGGNTGLVGGATPYGQIVLSTRRLIDIGPVDGAAGQITVGAGVTIGDVQAAAQAAGWRYGVDLGSRDSATVGGTIATNAGGVHVIRFGATRSQVLGLEAVLGTGDVVSRLDGLVKDNTGYDLAGLMCGSEGTLGVVTRARLALVAPNATTTTALVAFDSIEAAVAAVGVLRRRVPGVEAVELVLGDGASLVATTMDIRVPVTVSAALVVVEGVGDPGAIGAAVESLAGVRDTAVATDETGRAGLWAVREMHTEAIGRVGVALKFDVTIPAVAMAATIEVVRSGVGRIDPDLQVWIFGHAADGNLHVNVTGAVPGHVDLVSSIEEEVLGHVVDVGGSISSEHGIGRAKLAWLARNRGPGDMAAMRRLKDAFDPDEILNPGALIPPRAD